MVILKLQTCMHTRTSRPTHTHKHTHSWCVCLCEVIVKPHTRKCAQAHIHTNTPRVEVIVKPHTRTRTNTHTHTHTHTHQHMHSHPCGVCSSPAEWLQHASCALGASSGHCGLRPPATLETGERSVTYADIMTLYWKGTPGCLARVCVSVCTRMWVCA